MFISPAEVWVPEEQHIRLASVFLSAEHLTKHFLHIPWRMEYHAIVLGFCSDFA